ncbi:PREDICTED: uncharacterized protein LOC107193056 [Dufourea novaeangliae]|uniref:uncharacterized protein LOC107193056 n=1 Tax=Dufourea novaeangliae TaxID=178035 RepID=UPI000766ED5C|nr:PREDICTED: uncharacterized protein LOC107193056 [Dufourea novaeangliae]
MASFWFLDTLALHVHRQKKTLDHYYLSVLISWLAGEMTLIRDKKHSREEFFRELKHMFLLASNKIAEENRLPYWDEIELAGSTEETDMENEGNRPANDRDSTAKYVVQRVDVFFSSLDPLFVLDIVIRSTYDMYANELRYYLVYAVFVEPIEVQSYQLPFNLRTPRPVKLGESESMPFNMRLYQKFSAMRPTEGSKKMAKKTKGKGKKTGRHEVPETPIHSPTDEENLANKRQFILPLIEANEAVQMFEMLKDDV